MDIVSYVLAKKQAGNAGLPERGQANWNQNDPAAPDYIKNRPFYEMPGEVIYDGNLEFKLNIQGHNPYNDKFIEVKKPFEVGKIYIITIDGEECLCVCEGEANDNIIILHHSFLNGGHGYIRNSDFSCRVYMNPNSYNDFTVHLTIKETDTIHKLDEKFIPDTIARTNDYVSDNEIIDILIQEDMLFALTDSTGSILTDESNNVLTW